MIDWYYEKWMERIKESQSSVDHAEFRKQYLLGEWPICDAVYSREEVEKMLRRGEISEIRADEMLRMRWKVNSKGEKVVDRRNYERVESI